MSTKFRGIVYWTAVMLANFLMFGIFLSIGDRLSSTGNFVAGSVFGGFSLIFLVQATEDYFKGK